MLALAMLRKVRVMIKLGRGRDAMELVDEAMVAAVAGELRPMTTGIVYCATIDVCNDLFDFTRSREWTEASMRWCERTSVAGFPGVCRAHASAVTRSIRTSAERRRLRC